MSEQEWRVEHRAMEMFAAEYDGDEDAVPWSKAPGWERALFLRRADAEMVAAGELAPVRRAEYPPLTQEQEDILMVAFAGLKPRKP